MPLLLIVVAAVVIFFMVKSANEKQYKELEAEILKRLGFTSWGIVPFIDDTATVKSRQSLQTYDEVKFFRENQAKLARAKTILERKRKVLNTLHEFLKNNEYRERPQYDKIATRLNQIMANARYYRICVTYISSAGNNLGSKTIELSERDVQRFENNPTLLMTKGEYSQHLKELEKNALIKKQHDYYDRINKIIDYVNEKRSFVFIKGSAEQLDNLIAQLFDRTVNSIKKIKTSTSEEWDVINKFISHIEEEIKKIVEKNQRILDYYESPSFLRIKDTCEALMSTQREFNEYIQEKVESISQLFGTRVTRNETTNEDEYQYIRPYHKTITPFAAEVSSTVFASAENNPLDYVIKSFYPNKSLYPEQIQKLHLLIEELATLRDAKQIIENYKKDYQQYITGVPKYVMEEDESGFYSRLGFAYIDESILTVEYTFSYTSGGGKAKRTFAVPMTEDTIVELIKLLEEKLTMRSFTREQRALMTNKLRESIKSRDNFTCCICGNSTHTEPNLLLEIDHIIPVSKGGCTTVENLQTLCWKCNRTKSNKLKSEV